jgi:MinD-like ATPase involved in chromosome partitioning or flagellar assembly/tetratricopeptide (TPR) repeat protein
MSEVPAHVPPESRAGQVVTFYSYKGGTGRTMALANVAWILAASGRRVLVADWDLESPGLHRFYHPFLDEAAVRNSSGIIDMIRSYELAAASAHGRGTGNDAAGKPAGRARDTTRKLIEDHARVERHAMSLDWEFPEDGGLDFLSSGRQNLDYTASPASLDWDNFYDSLNGGKFLDAMCADMKAHYDYVLIDSRTGLSDIAGICTQQFPDVLVDCFTLSTQGIEGAAQVAREIEQRHKKIRILPVAMRVEDAEKEKVEAGRAVAVRLFAGLPGGMSEERRRDYWSAVEVPYRPFYAYEETLAVFGDQPGSPTTMLAAFERLADQITGGAVTRLAPMDDSVRSRTRQLFSRKAPPTVTDQVIVEFRPEDEVWYEWIADVLRSAGMGVRERRLGGSGVADGELTGPAQTLTVVSARFVEWYRAQEGQVSPPEMPIYVTSTRPVQEFSAVPATFIVGVPEQDALGRLLRLVGIARPAGGLGREAAGIRYPGEIPKIDVAPVPNRLFTGREEDLRRLREQLRDYGSSAFRPVVLQGHGGVGKTQVALEYVNRFKTDYDLVFWIDCSQPQFVDAALADLGARMQSRFNVGVPATAGATEAVRVVLQALSERQIVPRWLLIFDNAEDFDAVRRYLPTGGGHVLITSRHRGWADLSLPLVVEPFTRADSIAHLRRRVPSIGTDDAGQLAQVLGNLPLAVASAGAWLAETGHPVPDYLHQLRTQPAAALAASHLPDYPLPVSNAWDMSLGLLRERSPAAARLFELCSVMAPAISLELLYSAAMARVLERIDPAMAVPEVIGTAVRDIDKLALIKLDHNSHQIFVHGLVQDIVQKGMAAESPDKLLDTRRDVHEVLAAARPSRGIDNPDTWDRYQLLWPHLGPSGAVESVREPVRQLLIDRVRYLYLRDDAERGRELAIEIEKTWQAELDRAAPGPAAVPLLRELLHLRFNLANILRQQAKFEEAFALDDRVLTEQRELLDAHHPHTLMTAGGLAADLRALGRYQDALEMDEETHPAWRDTFGDSHPRTLAAANNLGVSYRLTGSIADALRVDEETLQRQRPTMGPLHPRTLGTASNVVRDLIEAGRYTEAASRMEAVHRSGATEYGADSLLALNAQVLLGIALRNAGRPQEAEAHFQSASAGLIRRLGDSSTEALAARLGHALNLVALLRAEEADAEIEAVQEVYERTLGPRHPHTLVCQLDHVCARRTGDRDDAALEIIASVAERLDAVLGTNHPYTLAAGSVRGVLLADQGNLKLAEKTESLVVERLSGTLGLDHPDTLRCRANLLLTRVNLGASGARAERTHLIDRLVPVLGADHPQITMLRGEHRLLHTLDPQPF